MEKEFIHLLLSYMTTDDKSIIVRKPKKSLNDVEGFEYISTSEGNGFKAIINGDEFVYPCSYIGKANNLSLHLCSYSDDVLSVDKNTSFSENTVEDIIIIVADGKLAAFAPICDNILKIMEFMLYLRKYKYHNTSEQEEYVMNICADLVCFFYRNHPHKIPEEKFFL